MLGKWVAIGRFAEILIWSIAGAVGVVLLWGLLALAVAWTTFAFVRRRRRRRGR